MSKRGKKVGAYGVAELSEAIEVDRYKVGVWRQRRTHDMPEPDFELRCGPIWLAATIEPWIRKVRRLTAAA